MAGKKNLRGPLDLDGRNQAQWTPQPVTVPALDADKLDGQHGSYYAPGGSAHVAVTITDTASVDLALTGQALTATVLPAGVDHAGLANKAYADAGHTGFQPTLTTGNLTATAPIVFDQTRQVIGGAAVVSIPAATALVPGYATAAQITKLDGIAAGAQVNVLEGVTGTSPVVAGAVTAKSQAISIPAATNAAAGHMTAAHVQALEAATGAQHAAVTLDADADTLLSLNTQALGLDTQTANYGLWGPTSGATPAVPTFRAMVTADVPAGIITLAKLANMATASLYYRKAAGDGAPEVQTLATLKTDLGSMPAVAHNLLSAIHGDTTTAAAVRGDLVTAQGATPAWARLALGGIVGSVLTRDATDVAWSAGALAFAGAYTLTVPATGTVLLTDGTQTGATAQAQTFTNGIIGPTWKPAANSTTALILANAAGTGILNIDSTNARVQIGPIADVGALTGVLNVAKSEDAFNNMFILKNASASTSAATALQIVSDNASFQIGILSSVHTTYPVYGAPGDAFYRSSAFAKALNLIASSTADGNMAFFAGYPANNPPTLYLQVATRNVGIGGTKVFGTSATMTVGISSGTAPSTSPADMIQMWSADQGGTAGNAGLHVRSEAGNILSFGARLALGVDIELTEMGAPAAGAANTARLFARDDGTGVTEYCARFATGDILPLACQGVTIPTYTISNVTTDRSCDADTVAVAELADIVGTLIADLRARHWLL
jgi:hypothetical protein